MFSTLLQLTTLILPSPSAPLRCVNYCSSHAQILMSGAAGSAAGGGGDLSGGTDSQRNADLNSLRKMFAAPAADVDTSDSIGTDDQNGKADARKLGLFQDIPLCRF